jgi:hypothetical protein
MDAKYVIIKSVAKKSAKLSGKVIDYYTNVKYWEMEVREYDRINHPSRTPRNIRDMLIIRLNAKGKGSIEFLTPEEVQQNKI